MRGAHEGESILPDEPEPRTDRAAIAHLDLDAIDGRPRIAGPAGQFRDASPPDVVEGAARLPERAVGRRCARRGRLRSGAGIPARLEEISAGAAATQAGENRDADKYRGETPRASPPGATTSVTRAPRTLAELERRHCPCRLAQAACRGSPRFPRARPAAKMAGRYDCCDSRTATGPPGTRRNEGGP
jgi:hypothetical protein